MGKLLFWIVVIALIWVAFSLIRVSQRKQERAQADGDAARSAGSGGGRRRASGGAPERMVACGHCGVYLPYNDAIHGRGVDGGEYCCIEHRNAARR